MQPEEVTSTFQSFYAPVNGLQMYYEIHGQGKPLVLIHGGGSTIGTTFGRILPELARNHQVIAVELQAHGHTADIDRPLSFEQDADDIAQLLNHLNISKSDIFGFSNGGTTALQLAIRHPEVVDHLIVASTLFKRDGAPPFFWDFMDSATFEQMPEALKSAYLEINPDPYALQKMHDRDVIRMQNFEDIPEEDLQHIKANTLIISGDKDVSTPEHAVELSRLIGQSQLMILPGEHGEYMGEITTLKAEKSGYSALVLLIEDFLKSSQPCEISGHRG